MVESNVRTVRYIGTQSAEDLYRCVENNRVYIRQICDDRYVRWLSSNKWRGGYEASASLKEGLVMTVVNKANEPLFAETLVCKEGYCDTVAEKMCGFADEELKKIAHRVIEQMNLKEYNQWKAWMMRSAKKCQYTGYSENWMYAEVDYTEEQVLFKCEYLGQEAVVTTETAVHRISGQTWKYVEIKDKSRTETLWLCGFIYEEDQ